MVQDLFRVIPVRFCTRSMPRPQGAVTRLLRDSTRVRIQNEMMLTQVRKAIIRELSCAKTKRRRLMLAGLSSLSWFRFLTARSARISAGVVEDAMSRKKEIFFILWLRIPKPTETDLEIYRLLDRWDVQRCTPLVAFLARECVQIRAEWLIFPFYRSSAL